MNAKEKQPTVTNHPTQMEERVQLSNQIVPKLLKNSLQDSQARSNSIVLLPHAHCLLFLDTQA